MNVRSVMVVVGLVLLSACARTNGAQVFDQPAKPAGGQYKSAWYPPDGLDGDEYVFDNFTLASSVAINEIHWRGGYTNYLSGAGKSPVFDFDISIYRSIGSGGQPDLGTGGRLAHYTVGGNAGETAVGIFGGVIMYDYDYVLPAPFQAAAGTTYWVQIEASQGVTPTFGWPPDWSWAAATGGNNAHFRRITGGPTQVLAGDAAFSLYSSGAPTVTISASDSPSGSASIVGPGVYPINSIVTLDAFPHAGWGFVNWTEGGSLVSTNAHYTFNATVDRTLVAHCVPAYTISTASYPSYAGIVSGAGVYNSGTTVTLTAAPNHGFVFSGWSDGATTPTHSFIATSDVTLTAFFASAPLSVTFDFDNARQYAPFPIDLTVNGLWAHFSGTGEGYSVQAVGTVGISPPGFSGLCAFPSSVFASDLVIDFSQTLVDFSVLYSPQELGCDDSARMRVTVFLNGTFVATNTTTASAPGTWPSATLSIAAPAGFNRAVVHYDARPPTCADYGVIFLADNVTVTRAFLCPTDFNGDGFVTGDDFDAFVLAFIAGDNAADFDHNGFVTGEDFDAYVAAFEQGC